MNTQTCDKLAPQPPRTGSVPPLTPHPVSVAAVHGMLDAHRYGVEYQPIFDANSDRLLGYEALARCYDSDGSALPTPGVFAALHPFPSALHAAEYSMKCMQLRHAPAVGRLFVNVDPDAFIAGQDCGPHSLAELLCGHPGVVVEIIENSTLHNAEASQVLAVAFRQRGVTLALDDIGAPSTMIALPLLLTVDMLKFDRTWLHTLRDPASRSAMRHLVGFARETGKRTVLEGIETEAQRRLAVELGIDFVQGFLFRSEFRRSDDWARNVYA